MIIKYNNHLCFKKYDIFFKYYLSQGNNFHFMSYFSNRCFYLYFFMNCLYCLHKDGFSLYCYKPHNTKTYNYKYPSNKYVNLFNFICNHVNKI